MASIDLQKKIKYGLLVSVALLAMVLLIAFINMRSTIASSNKETVVLRVIKNIEAIQLNVEHLEHLKDAYSQSGNEIYLKEYEEVSAKIKENKNELLNYSIKHNYKKDDILLLANIAARHITNNNKLLDIKRYNDSSLAEIPFFESNGNKQVDSIINLSGRLEKDAIGVLKNTTEEKQKANTQQIILYLLLAILFVTSILFAYLFTKANLKKAEKINKLLLYNSTLLQNINDAIITADNNYKITDWNVHAENLYGYSAKEAIGKSMLSLFNIDEHNTEKLIEPMFVNDVWKGEAIQYHKNGMPINVDISKTVVKDGDGLKTGCICVIRNITPRVKLENDLKSLSENLQEQVNLRAAELNLVFERIADAFVAFDNDGNYTYLNKAALLHHGAAEEDIIGKNLWEQYPDLVKQPFYDAVQLAKKTQQPQRCELYYQEIDSWFSDLIYPSPNGVSIYYHDITDKKKAEIALSIAQQELIDADGKFRALVEKSMVGVYIRKGRKMLYVNPRFVELFGYKEEELYNNFDFMTLVEEGDRSLIEESVRAYDTHKTNTHNYEFKAVDKNGNIIYANTFGSATTFNGEDVIIGNVIDISKRKNAEQSLLLADEALRISNEVFELVAKATRDGIWDWDIENDILGGNEIFCSMLGLNEFEKSNNSHFFERVHPEDRERLFDNFKIAIQENTSSLTEEFRFVDKEGNYRTIYDRAYILYKNKVAYRMVGAMQDITLLKESETKLRLEKAISDSIINTLPGIFYLFNKDGKYLRWNNNLETVSGYTPEEIGKIHPLDLIAPNETEIISEKIRNVFVEGNDIAEANFKTKSGKLIPYYFTGMYIKYEGQDCLMGVGLDISEKIKSQQELFESEQKFRTLVQQASDGIIITDEEGNFIEVNESAATLTGYQKQEFTTMNIQDIFFEEGGIRRPLRYNAMASGAVVISEHFIRRKGGKMINVEVSAKQLSDGRFQRILRDITERTQVEDALRASEKKYRLLFNDNPLPMWINNQTDNNFIDVNNAALVAYGYSKKEFLKMNLSDLNSYNNNVKRPSPNNRKSETAIDGIYEHVKNNGEIMKVDVLTHDIIYEGKPAILSLANDITAKLEAEESLQRSNEALRDLASHLETIRENERIHMAREIHDELGQQLTGLKMDISWLSRKIKSDDEAINDKMKDTMELIDKTVVTVRRIATELRPSILDDLGLIDAMEWQSEEFEKRSEIKSIFKTNVSQIEVSADVATAMFRIFQESLTNVLRHSKATEVISFFRLENYVITLFIEDNGIGFNEQAIKNKKTLGLLGMKERIELINGKYEINGNSGKGTSVIITVPLK